MRRAETTDDKTLDGRRLDEKIFSIVMSFRMMPFPPREAMTTAVAAGAVDFSAFGIHYNQRILHLMAESFRMMPFPPREAMTTAAAAGAVDFPAFRIHYNQRNSS